MRLQPVRGWQHDAAVSYDVEEVDVHHKVSFIEDHRSMLCLIMARSLTAYHASSLQGSLMIASALLPPPPLPFGKMLTAELGTSEPQLF